MRMKDSPLMATKTPLRLTADPSRVLPRQFVPGNPGQVRQIVRRVGSMRPSAVEATLREMKRAFGPRYKDIDRILQSHYESVAGGLDRNGALTGDQKQLIGAYFTMEYSLESVALFNPSMVPHPDQTGLKPGETRLVLSLRACGEGHIPSVVFRSGVVSAALRLSLEEFRARDGEARGTLAERLGLPVARVEDLVSFYSLLHEAPRGAHTTTVCKSLSCRLLGSDDVAERFRRAIGLEAGETTPDGRVTLEEVECIGACDRAPACIVDGELHGPLDGAAIDRIIGEIG